MTLPIIPQSSVGVSSINWHGLPHRYINDGEMEVLVALARSVNAETAIEIGCNEGRTSRLLLENVRTLGKLVGIDVMPGYEFAKPVQRNEVPPRPGIYALGHPGFELIIRKFGSFDVRPDELPAADFIFIDGDHGREAVTHDTALAKVLIRPGGIIAWHDYHERGNVDVKPVLDELRAAGDDIQCVESTWIAFLRC